MENAETRPCLTDGRGLVCQDVTWKTAGLGLWGSEPRQSGAGLQKAQADCPADPTLRT